LFSGDAPNERSSELFSRDASNEKNPTSVARHLPPSSVCLAVMRQTAKRLDLFSRDASNEKASLRLPRVWPPSSRCSAVVRKTEKARFLTMMRQTKKTQVAPSLPQLDLFSGDASNDKCSTCLPLMRQTKEKKIGHSASPPAQFV
jgi:hypothetical protein